MMIYLIKIEQRSHISINISKEVRIWQDHSSSKKELAFMVRRANHSDEQSKKNDHRKHENKRMPNLRLKPNRGSRVPISQSELKRWVKQKYELRKLPQNVSAVKGPIQICNKLREMLVKQNLFCSICLEVMIKPYITVCGHYYCQTCLKNSLLYKKRCSICRLHLDSSHIKRSIIAEQIICEVYLKNLNLNEQLLYETRIEQDKLRSTIMQDLQRLDIIDFFDDTHKKWKSAIIINLRRDPAKRVTSAVLLEIERLELLNVPFDEYKFKISGLTRSSTFVNSLNPFTFLEQNRLRKNSMILRISRYWDKLQSFMLSFQQMHNLPTVYFSLRCARQQLIRELHLRRYYSRSRRVEADDEESQSELQEIRYSYNNVKSKLSRWLLHQLLQYEGQYKNGQIILNSERNSVNNDDLTGLETEMVAMSLNDNDNRMDEQLADDTQSVHSHTSFNLDKSIDASQSYRLNDYQCSQISESDLAANIHQMMSSGIYEESIYPLRGSMSNEEPQISFFIDSE